MRKAIFGLALLTGLASCSTDVLDERSYSVSHLDHQLNGDYVISLEGDDDFYGRFLYNWIDSTTNTSFNLFQSSVSNTPKAYRFFKVNDLGEVTYEVRMSTFNVDPYGNLTIDSEYEVFEVLDFVINEDNVVESMNVVTPSGTASSLQIIE